MGRDQAPRPWVDRRPGFAAPPNARPYPAPPPSIDLLDPATDELVAGRRPVEEAFVARREARRLLVVPQRRQALEKLVLHATSLRIPIVEVEGGTLTALSGFDGHQGIALVVAPRRYAEVDDILARAIERDEAPFVLVLDSLEDPHNVGTLLRSAEAAATHGVVFPTRHQAPMSPSAIKASAGAVEHLLLAPVDDLPGALADLHVRGLRIVGADADAALTVREADLRGPLALVVGSEGQGLGPAVRRRCDLLVRIPMRGAVGSLNASVAGSILLYEATTQRGGPTERPTKKSPAWSAAPSAGEDVLEVADESTAPLADGAPAETPPPSPRRARVRKAVATPEPIVDPASTAEAAPEPGPAPEPVAEPEAAPVAEATSKPVAAPKTKVARTKASTKTSTKKKAAKKPAGAKKAARSKKAAAADEDSDGLLPGGPRPDA
jgi:23S rRNA (guanosine2251-2'-O)-methyltransferase